MAAKEDVSFMCNALIPGRDPLVLRPVTKVVGNWIRGTVTLRDDHLRFGTNALNAVFQGTHPDLVIRYGDISMCSLGRYAVFLKTVDLQTPEGEIRFRCLVAWNETLLTELRKRISGENPPSTTAG